MTGMKMMPIRCLGNNDIVVELWSRGNGGMKEDVKRLFI